MKKFLSLILITLCIILLNTFTVLASEKKYSIDELKINAILDKDGNLSVTEDYYYNFQGSFNGITRDIDYNGAKDVEGIEVIKNDTISFKINDNKDENTFELKNPNNSKNLKIYSRNNDCKTKFTIKYKIIGAAYKSSNQGNLKWIFYKNTNDVNITNLNLNLVFKDELNGEVKYFGVGPENGSAESLNNNTFLFKVKSLNKNELFGAKLSFDSNYLTGVSGIEDRNVQDNLYKNSYKELFYAIPLVVILIGLIGGFIFNDKKKYNKELKEYRAKYAIFNKPYLEEKPENLNATLAYYILNEDIDNKCLMVTLLDLVNKGALTYTVGENEDDKKNFKFTINSNNFTKLLKYERFIIKWFSEYGKNGSFSIYDIEKNTKYYSDSKNFKNKFNECTSLVIDEGENLINYVIIVRRRILDNKSYDQKLRLKAFKKYIIKKTSTEVDLNFCKEYINYIVAFDLEESFININLPEDYSFLNGIALMTIYHQDVYNDIDRRVSPNTSSTSTFTSSGGDCGGGGGSGAF